MLEWDTRLENVLDIIRDQGNKIGRFLFVSGMTYKNRGLTWKYDDTTNKYSVDIDYLL